MKYVHIIIHVHIIVLTVIFQVNLGQPVPYLVLFLHQFQTRTSKDKWHRMPFLAPNQQHQSTEGNKGQQCIHWTQFFCSLTESRNISTKKTVKYPVQ